MLWIVKFSSKTDCPTTIIVAKNSVNQGTESEEHRINGRVVQKLD